MWLVPNASSRKQLVQAVYFPNLGCIDMHKHVSHLALLCMRRWRYGILLILQLYFMIKLIYVNLLTYYLVNTNLVNCTLYSGFLERIIIMVSVTTRWSHIFGLLFYYIAYEHLHTHKLPTRMLRNIKIKKIHKLLQCTWYIANMNLVMGIYIMLEYEVFYFISQETDFPVRINLNMKLHASIHFNPLCSQLLFPMMSP